MQRCPTELILLVSTVCMPHTLVKLSRTLYSRQAEGVDASAGLYGCRILPTDHLYVVPPCRFFLHIPGAST